MKSREVLAVFDPAALLRWMARPRKRVVDKQASKERRRLRDREAKRLRYAQDVAYREARCARARAKYATDPEKVRARMRIENMTPERVDVQRIRQAARHWSERTSRLRYAYRYRVKPKVKQRRRELYRTKALLRAVLARLAA